MRHIYVRNIEGIVYKRLLDELCKVDLVPAEEFLLIEYDIACADHLLLAGYLDIKDIRPFVSDEESNVCSWCELVLAGEGLI